MAKGQMRSNKEKKKPKQDKNKKDKGAAPSPFAAGQGQPGQNPTARKVHETTSCSAGRGSNPCPASRLLASRRHASTRGARRLGAETWRGDLARGAWRAET